MKKEEKIEAKRHTLAHLLAAAIAELYPDAKRAIGPAIENGFYYDFEFSSPLSENELPKIEKKMREILLSWDTFTRFEVSKDEARKEFNGNPYKVELIEEFAKEGEKLTIYQSGTFRDLCRGGHSENPAKDIAPDVFKLSHIAGAYWRGDEKNKMLTRIYGLAFETRKELDAYTEQREEAKKRDHKKLGAELDLFIIDEKVGRGLPMWTPKGTVIKFEMENLARTLEKKYEYEHVETPYLGSEELYRMSGHLDHYKSSMYAPIDMDGEKYYLRPMACPHHIRMYQRKPWSYRDLPIRYAEIADYNRYEKSGELMGMIRARKFQLTDAHIFVSPEELKEEFKSVCTMIAEGMEALGLSEIVSYRFSKRDPNNKEKYYPNDSLWQKAESTMKEALDELGFSYVEALDEAAFYGPKLDVQAKNVNGKEDTLFTAQMDFLLPEKFDIEYIDADGNKKRPVMIHRSTIGSLERVFGFLIEHYAGAFPLWLSPVQVKVLPISEKQVDYAKTIYKALKEKGIRTECDDSNETLGKKIRQGKLEKVPYLLVIGDREMEHHSVTLESRDNGNLGSMTIEQLTEKLLADIATKV